MLNLDPAKLLIIAVVAIILLGPDKLPQVARQVGGAWRSFNEFRHRMEADVRSSIPDLPSSTEIARLARSPSALLNHLSNLSPNGNGSGGVDGEGSGSVGEDGSGSEGAAREAPPGGLGAVVTPQEMPSADRESAQGPTPVHPSQVFVPGDPSLN